MTTQQIPRAFVLTALLTLSQVTGAAAQVTWTVTTNADGELGSLRDTVASASAGDTVQFDMTRVTSPIDLSGGQIEILKSLTIQGPGATLLTVRNTLAGSRVFLIGGGDTVTISGLTVSGGNVAFPERGGGILNRGTLTLAYATVTDNRSGNDSGGIENDNGVLTVAHSTVSNNVAAAGGGIATFGPGASVTVTHSTISGNSTTPAGGGNGGGIRHYSGPLTVANSTISGNSAAGIGGGIDSSGVLTIVNSTLSGNTARLTGGLRTAEPTTLQNAILANNVGPGGDCLRDGSNIVNATHSLIESDLSCVNGTNVNNLTGDPMLGPLQDNGGPTQTHALEADSRAINAGNTELALDENGDPLTSDQRGTGFARVKGARVDIGAFEVDPPDTTPPVIRYTLTPATPGSGFWYRESVNLVWTVTDAESTPSSSGCDPVTVSADQALTAYTCSASSTGGSASATVTIGFDATAPTLAPSLAAGSQFALGQPAPTVTPNASDAGSGLASSSCGLVDTTSVGVRSVTCTATDQAGNVRTASVSYTVTDAFLGFSAPLPRSTQKKGSTIPVKFTLGNYSGTTRVTNATVIVRTSTAAAPTATVTQGTCAYSATIAAYQCQLRMPATPGDYLISVLELVQSGPEVYTLVVSASVATNTNPMPIRIR